MPRPKHLERKFIYAVAEWQYTVPMFEIKNGWKHIFSYAKSQHNIYHLHKKEIFSVSINDRITYILLTNDHVLFLPVNRYFLSLWPSWTNFFVTVGHPIQTWPPLPLPPSQKTPPPPPPPPPPAKRPPRSNLGSILSPAYMLPLRTPGAGLA